ncbi:diacylglycerol/lipid kinase family protein [Lactococcus garvieae]|jgi:YegS/Rv2252/BmrU family lipid kinase|uniref:diacylglycerol/lipid kinase family protein n=1 Tax=Lactococcus garvieae TaxID=1363 RepID=UPI000266A692|nr:diacylglycerol kinase family protein [Lactococcus garvieae]MDN5628435.1 diacylglycerol kinase family lipid kinase [Lactococcus sp.]EIT66720.1 Transcription regulator [Lactococcus garvieae IPLA 31405]MBS4463058.1 diacylglycerol kinase family lipid kinase [Lactococcus garvieae]MCO7129387.1 diacylglycerol kinase family lipid kinase [Lactococcus garvieae]MDB7634981.1 diacylglycerol kinase family lipid kinase [Lactococcus garvieae]
MIYYILANPNAGSRKGERSLKLLLPYLEKEGLSYKLFATEHTGQEASFIQIILEEKSTEDQLIILGGDGTISLALNALPDDLPFGYIPSGSGNDFARSLGLSFDPIQAFKNIRQNKTKDFYVIHYKSQSFSGYALNNVGIGLDAAIVKATNGGRMKNMLNALKLGRLSYFLTALHVLFSKKPFEISVYNMKNAFKFDNAFLLTFTKHPYFGGGIQIAPEATNLSKEIHLVELDRYSIPKIFSLIPSVLKGKHLDNNLFHHSVSTAAAVTPQSVQPVQIDGESFTIQANDTLTLTSEKRKIIC